MTVNRFHDSTLPGLFRSFWKNRSLIGQMTRREVVGRYRGSLFGLAWSLFNPILMLVVYTIVFSVVFKARWGLDTQESKSDFAVVLFVGLIVHGLLAECVNRAPGLIVSNANFVKKVVFPLEILPWVAMGAALFQVAVCTLVLLAAQLVLNLSLPWTAVFLPIVLLPLVLATMGFSFFLSATGVFVRDITQAVGIITTVMLFLAPVFYPVSALPQEYQIWVLINPLTLIIEEARKVLIWGKLPEWSSLGIYGIASLAVAWAGFWWFQKTRNGFADVL